MRKEKNAASPVDVLSVLDGSKENYAGKCVAEEEEEHAHDDEEALVHADHHGQQQHLQSHLNSSHTHKFIIRIHIWTFWAKDSPAQTYSHASHIS